MNADIHEGDGVLGIERSPIAAITSLQQTPIGASPINAMNADLGTHP